MFEMAASNYSLKVNRELLDPSFESYRLALDSLPSYKIKLDAAVSEATLADSQYTLDHVRAFGMYNYLHSDPWYKDSVYFVDCKGRLMNLSITLDTALAKPREVFRLPEEFCSCENRLCASLSLASATWAALSDGTGKLYLLRTGKRGESALSRWEPLFTRDLGEPFILTHSLSYVSDGALSVDLLLLRVQPEQSDARGSGFAVSLEWLTVAGLTGQGQEKTFEVTRSRVLRGKSVPHYAAVEPCGRGLMVASEKPFKFTHVDGRPVEEPAQEPTELEEKKEPVYFWQQTGDDVTVMVYLPEGTVVEDIAFNVSSDRLSIGVRDQVPLIEGRLHSEVIPDTCVWILRKDKRMEVYLKKRDRGPVWPELVTGDRSGEQLVSKEQATLVHERLAHLTSEDLSTNTEKSKPPCNAQELEDCDLLPEDGSSLVRFDSKSLRPTHVVNLGSHQYLFTVDVDPLEMPCFCLRHDVDALLWQPRPDRPDSMWEHVATFNALGYVQASKRDRKFSTCAPNFSYAALSECLRRVFIYRQPAPVDTVLVNRRQGRQIGQVAKQQVASLDSSDPVLGFRATDERVFVLTSHHLFVLKVNNYV